MSSNRTAPASKVDLWRSVWLFLAFTVTIGGLHTILAGIHWWIFSLLLIVLIFGSGILVRAVLGAGTLAARILAPVVGAIALLVTLVVSFVSDVSWLGFVPTGRSLDRVAKLLHDVSYSIIWQDVPANADAPILFLLGLGVGVLLLLAEIATFSLTLPALAGFPLLAVFLVPSFPPEGTTDGALFAASALAYFGLLLAGRPRRLVASLAIGTIAITGGLVLPGLMPSTKTTATASGLGPSVATGVNPMLRLGDDLREPDARVALTYSTVSGTPHYLRLVEVSNFFSLNWGPTQPALDVDNRPVEFPRPPGLGVGVTTWREVSYLHVANLLSPWLPVPYPASSITGLEGSWQYVPDSFTVASNRTLARGENYTVSSFVLDPTPDQLLASGTRVPANLDQYLSLPPDLPATISKTAQDVTRGKATNYEKALALQEFLRSPPFQYSTTAPVADGYDGTGVDVVAKFLEARSGYCIHFASAMAVLARDIGIPSRIIVGFQPGTLQNGDDDGRKLYQVTTADLHAWPELYFSGIGWIRFEPTPSRGVVPDYANPLVTGVPDVQTPAAGVGNLDASGLNPSAPLIDAGPTLAGWLTSDQPNRWLGWGALVLAPLGLILLPAGLRSLRRARILGRLRGGTGSVAAAWRELRESAEDVGVALLPTNTPREAVDILRRSHGMTETGNAALERIELAVETEGYGRPAGLSAESARTLAADLGTVIRCLHSGAEGNSRWRTLLLPPSLMGRTLRSARRLV
ncbi:MAG: DUF3488 and transglutaminase-like domain-containing protein [Terrimesophilobacter sp.]